MSESAQAHLTANSTSGRDAASARTWKTLIRMYYRQAGGLELRPPWWLSALTPVSKDGYTPET
jgi:hypothetical protein